MAAVAEEAAVADMAAVAEEATGGGGDSDGLGEEGEGGACPAGQRGSGKYASTTVVTCISVQTKRLETVLVGWKSRSTPSLMRTILHPLTPSLWNPLVIPIPFPNFLFRTSSNYRPDLIDDTAALVRILDECQSPRSLSALCDLHSRLLDRGLASHPSIQVKIMRAYAACGEPARARSVFDDAPVKTTIFFNVMIRSYVAHRLNREALLLFSEMVRLHRVKPDNYTFPCALKACSDSENLQGGLQIHGAVAKLGLDANLFVGNTLITLYSKCGRFDDAFRSFGERPTWRRWGG